MIKYEAGVAIDWVKVDLKARRNASLGLNCRKCEHLDAIHFLADGLTFADAAATPNLEPE